MCNLVKIIRSAWIIPFTLFQYIYIYILPIITIYRIQRNGSERRREIAATVCVADTIRLLLHIVRIFFSSHAISHATRSELRPGEKAAACRHVEGVPPKPPTGLLFVRTFAGK
ncbi:hypothetical protein PUN28_014521 [Cardiocondyla obscurior]|uniref:Uncharacterized protein n=1 Tax=Cardiocondyla obscurior TaxID=286306 RepID=A0AAW2F6E4_9HYME